MAAAAAESLGLLLPYLRSCEKEQAEPLDGELQGQVPVWLQGTLLRTGPGLLHVGEERYRHLFDGLALIHRFGIENGRVTYKNKFLRSDAYRKNTEAGKILMGEFGTPPDPCKTIFQRFSSMFISYESTDNDLVNLVKYTDEIYSSSEGKYIWRIDPDTLDALSKVDLSKLLTVRTGTAHPQEGKDGTVYNVGTTFGSSSMYNIFKFPPKKNPTAGAFDEGAVVCKIPPTRHFYPCYYHSFGMSENYFIFVEQPLYLSVPQLALSNITSKAFADCMHWQPEAKARFFVVRREDGAILPTHYVADAFFVFHHINAYEQDGHLVVDLCAYDDASVIKKLYVDAMEQAVDWTKKNGGLPYLLSQAKRYVLPLEDVIRGKAEKENLVKLDSCKATAYLQSDRSVICHPENLTGSEKWLIEMPRINYTYNERSYKYFYGIGRTEGSPSVCLVKVDAAAGKTQSWKDDAGIPSEPVFIADPNSTEEDGGVVVASLLHKDDEKKVSLVILDAKTMTEVARANFVTQSSVPGDFHGIFLGN